MRGISKSFSFSDQKTVIFDNLTYSFEKDQVITIVAPSGAGKSTLLNVVGLLDSLDGGEMIFDGVAYHNEKNKAKIRSKLFGFIFQSFNLLPEFTVLENIAMPQLISNQEINYEEIDVLLNNVGLIDKKNRYPKTLSGGEQQRVAMVRALINKPQVILADEPTGNLDAKNSKEVFEVLYHFTKKYHTTTLIVTHDLEIAALSDKVLKLQDGILKITT